MENFIEIGYRLGLIIPFWITIGLAVLALLCLLGARIDGPDSLWLVPMWTFGVFSLLAGAVLIASLIPFDTKYQHNYRVSGKVTNVSNVISEAGGDLTRSPVVTMEGVDRDIVMNDPRAVNLAGKNVDLTCTINWQYQGADKINCNIYKVNN